MKVPAWAGFVADFPDDQVERGGDIQVFGGRNVAAALGGIFHGLGCDRVSEPEPSGVMGWEFDVHFERHRVSCRVQSVPPVFWLLMDGASATKKGALAYVQLWRKFANALENDPRFHKILWRSSEEGPPDWDEVEAVRESDAMSFDEAFPESEIEPEKSNWGCLPIGIYLWFTASGIVTFLVGLFGEPTKENNEYLWLGLVMTIFFLALPVGVIFEAIKRRRQR
jgi:hypothetical protein